MWNARQSTALSGLKWKQTTRRVEATNPLLHASITAINKLRVVDFDKAAMHDGKVTF